MVTTSIGCRAAQYPRLQGWPINREQVAMGMRFVHCAVTYPELASDDGMPATGVAAMG
jgi:hypothetical protein